MFNECSALITHSASVVVDERQVKYEHLTQFSLGTVS